MGDSLSLSLSLSHLSQEVDESKEEDVASIRSGRMLQEEDSLDNSSLGSMSFTDDGINADQMKDQGEPDPTKGVRMRCRYFFLFDLRST